jgi:hypothetical protein
VRFGGTVYRLRWILATAGFFLLTAFLYRHTIHSKFIYDWNSWMLRYMDQDWSGLASAYGDGAMRWGYHLANVVMWKLFGFNAYGWFFAFTALHALNALLLMILVTEMLKLLSVKRPFTLALVAAGLWLVSPYHSETVVWGATSLYLTSTAMVLGGLILFLRYELAQRVHHAVLMFVCFLGAMLTHEGALIFPLLLIPIWLFIRNTPGKGLALNKFSLSILLPMIGMVGLYFIANKLRIGSWVGHYGEASHLNTDIYLIVPNLSKYLLKLLYAPLFFTFGQRDATYSILESQPSVWLQLVGWVAIGVFIIWKLVRGDSSWKLTATLVLLAMLALLPMINLYFMYHKDIEQDRYVYLPAAFFYAFLVIGSSFLLKRFALAPLTACFLISLVFLNRHTNKWALSGHISNSLLYDFRWQAAGRIFVLLTPDNVGGAYCMRSMPGSTLSEMLQVRRGIDVSRKLFEVYQWNVVSADDSAFCTVVDSSTIKLALIAPGAWFWRNSFGASSYGTGLFEAELDPHHSAFTVHFRKRRPDDVFIYAVNDHWQEVRF